MKRLETLLSIAVTASLLLAASPSAHAGWADNGWVIDSVSHYQSSAGGSTYTYLLTNSQCYCDSSWADNYQNSGTAANVDVNGHENFIWSGGGTPTSSFHYTVTAGASGHCTTAGGPLAQAGSTASDTHLSASSSCASNGSTSYDTTNSSDPHYLGPTVEYVSGLPPGTTSGYDDNEIKSNAASGIPYGPPHVSSSSHSFAGIGYSSFVSP